MAPKVRPDERGGVGAMGLMQGKRGLVMGVANDHSIAWGIAKVLRAHGAELAFTYQGEALGKRVAPLARSLGSDLVVPCDVEDLASVDAVFDALSHDRHVREGGVELLDVGALADEAVVHHQERVDRLVHTRRSLRMPGQ